MRKLGPKACMGFIWLLWLLASAVAQQVPTLGPPTGIACAYNSSPLTIATGQAGWVQCDANGKLLLGGSTAIIGKVQIDQSVPGTTNGVAIAPSSATGVGIAPVVAGSAASSSVLKASPGNLYGVYATCTSACWLMVFNAVAAPSNGSTTAGIASGGLQECIPIGATGVGSISYGSGPPEVFSVGITAAISSTACTTLTLSTVGYIHGSVQ